MRATCLRPTEPDHTHIAVEQRAGCLSTRRRALLGHSLALPLIRTHRFPRPGGNCSFILRRRAHVVADRGADVPEGGSSAQLHLVLCAGAAVAAPPTPTHAGVRRCSSAGLGHRSLDRLIGCCLVYFELACYVRVYFPNQNQLFRKFKQNLDQRHLCRWPPGPSRLVPAAAQELTSTN